VPQTIACGKAKTPMKCKAVSSLLAVDIGLKTGLALYDRDGRLCWYRSHHFAKPAALRRAMRGWLDSLPYLVWLILEGGGPLAELWLQEAGRRHLAVRQISAEAWRRQFLYAREQRRGAQAKQHATDLARRVIDWSQAPRPTSLRDDAAEAILVGLWGVLEVGWLPQLPQVLRR
jgi:hypothetical protein